MKVRFVFPANIEFDEAVRYYDHQLPGLGFRFFQQVDAAIERIRFMPEAWTKIGHRTRRCILKGFPYALFYAIEKDDGLVKSLKIDFLPQHIGWQMDKATKYCGQNKMLGLFTRPSKMIF